MEENTVRKDMHEVVIERPRRGGRYTYHDCRARVRGMDLDTLDDLPKKQGYRRPYIENWGDAKEFSDLLGPLYRFLISKVGEKWNDVYSEIRQTLNPDSTVQIHIMGHVDQFVETDTFMENGEVYVLGRYSRYNIGSGQLYVHPETGILCRTPEVSRKQTAEYHAAEKKLRGIFGKDWYEVVKGQKTHQPYWSHTRVEAEAENHVRVGCEKELHRMNGVWYWAVFSDVPPPFTQAWIDSVSGERRTRTIQRGACDYWTGVAHTEGRYRSGRRQASRRDLRRHGLRND